MGLQPRLADFKFIVSRTEGCPIDSQRLVQHKLDSVLKRSFAGPLSKVLISRGEGSDRRYYFSHEDVFDFLFY